MVRQKESRRIWLREYIYTVSRSERCQHVHTPRQDKLGARTHLAVHHTRTRPLQGSTASTASVRPSISLAPSQKSSPSSMSTPLIPPLCVRPPSRAFAVRICGTRFPSACRVLWPASCGNDTGGGSGSSSSSGSADPGNGYCTCSGAARGVFALPAPFFFRRAVLPELDVPLLLVDAFERAGTIAGATAAGAGEAAAEAEDAAERGR